MVLLKFPWFSCRIQVFPQDFIEVLKDLRDLLLRMAMNSLKKSSGFLRDLMNFWRISLRKFLDFLRSWGLYLLIKNLIDFIKDFKNSLMFRFLVFLIIWLISLSSSLISLRSSLISRRIWSILQAFIDFIRKFIEFLKDFTGFLDICLTSSGFHWCHEECHSFPWGFYEFPWEFIVFLRVSLFPSRISLISFRISMISLKQLLDFLRMSWISSRVFLFFLDFMDFRKDFIEFVASQHALHQQSSLHTHYHSLLNDYVQNQLPMKSMKSIRKLKKSYGKSIKFLTKFVKCSRNQANP